MLNFRHFVTDLHFFCEKIAIFLDKRCFLWYN